MKSLVLIFTIIVLASCASKTHKREIASSGIQEGAVYKFIDQLATKYISENDYSASAKKLCHHFRSKLNLPYTEEFCDENAINGFNPLVKILNLWKKHDKSNMSNLELNKFSKEVLGLSLSQVESCQGEKLEDIFSPSAQFKSSNTYACYSRIAEQWLIPTEYLYDLNYTGGSYFLLSPEFIGIKEDFIE